MLPPFEPRPILPVADDRPRPRRSLPPRRGELTPDQSRRESYLSLDEFIDEAMALFRRQPTPKEILVERVGALRWAERHGRFDSLVAMLGAAATSQASAAAR